MDALKAEQEEKTKELIRSFVKETTDTTSMLVGSISDEAINAAADKTFSLINDIAATGAYLCWQEVLSRSPLISISALVNRKSFTI